MLTEARAREINRHLTTSMRWNVSKWDRTSKLQGLCWYRTYAFIKNSSRIDSMVYESTRCMSFSVFDTLKSFCRTQPRTLVACACHQKNKQLNSDVKGDCTHVPRLNDEPPSSALCAMPPESLDTDGLWKVPERRRDALRHDFLSLALVIIKATPEIKALQLGYKIWFHTCSTTKRRHEKARTTFGCTVRDATGILRHRRIAKDAGEASRLPLLIRRLWRVGSWLIAQHGYVHTKQRVWWHAYKCDATHWCFVLIRQVTDQQTT